MAPAWLISVVPLLALASCATDGAAFDRELARDWQQVFFDPGTADWTNLWFLDGEQASVENSPAGMTLTAGPEFGNDAHHMVLWTKRSFAGDVRIEFEFTRLDSETRCVNIVYVQATGSGDGPYAPDIASWKQLRAVPAMRMYYDHMNTYHVSFAAFTNDGTGEAYIRARRYLPEANGLRGSELAPDFPPSQLFATGVPHHITIIKRDQQLFMRIENSEKQLDCRWINDSLPAIEAGRIGLRLMFTRSARFRDIRIFTRAKTGS